MYGSSTAQLETFAQLSILAAKLSVSGGNQILGGHFGLSGDGETFSTNHLILRRFVVLPCSFGLFGPFSSSPSCTRGPHLANRYGHDGHCGHSETMTWLHHLTPFQASGWPRGTFRSNSLLHFGHASVVCIWQVAVITTPFCTSPRASCAGARIGLANTYTPGP